METSQELIAEGRNLLNETQRPDISIDETITKTQEAQNKFKEAANQEPDNIEAYNLVGGTALALGQLSTAREAFEKVHQLDPDNQPATQGLITVQRLEAEANPASSMPPAPETHPTGNGHDPRPAAFAEEEPQLLEEPPKTVERRPWRSYIPAWRPSRPDWLTFRGCILPILIISLLVWLMLAQPWRWFDSQQSDTGQPKPIQATALPNRPTPSPAAPTATARPTSQAQSGAVQTATAQVTEPTATSAPTRELATRQPTATNVSITQPTATVAYPAPNSGTGAIAPQAVEPSAVQTITGSGTADYPIREPLLVTDQLTSSLYLENGDGLKALVRSGTGVATLTWFNSNGSPAGTANMQLDELTELRPITAASGQTVMIELRSTGKAPLDVELFVVKSASMPSTAGDCTDWPCP